MIRLLTGFWQRSDGDPVRVNYNFAKTVVSQAVPTLLNALTKQEDYDDDDDYNIAKAAYACLGLYALAVEDQIIPPVLEFVERNLRNEDWHHREAAVAAFGAILDGPDADTLISLVKQALPVLIGMMVDQSTNVQESVAFALSRICEYTPQAIEFDTMLPQLIQALLEGLKGTPKTAQSSCWGWMQVHGCIPVDLDPSKNPLVVHFEAIAQQLFAAADR